MNKNLFYPILIGSIFTLVILTIIFLRPKIEIKEDINLLLKEETLIHIDQPIREIQIVEDTRRLNIKTFEEGNYEYDERTKDFRLVCASPCSVSKRILDQEFAAISYAVSTLRGLTQSDIDENLLPFEVHATADDRCRGDYALAYMSKFIDSNGHQRGLLCFFYDELEYNRDKFPYSTSIHEVTHLFQSNKLPYDYSTEYKYSILWEGLAEMMDSFFLKGQENSFCGEGKLWMRDYSIECTTGHCLGRYLFFNLCDQYGFDYYHLPELFDELDRRKGNLDKIGFIQIINNIVGKDTTHLFREVGMI